MIKQSTISKIEAAAKVEDIVGDFVHLKKRGVNLLGLCPFHDEKTPSFTVSPAKNIYKCFGCGKSGTPIWFMMEHEGMTYPESLRYLASRYNIEIEETEDTEAEKAARELSASYYVINDFAQQYFEDQLFNSDEGKSVGLAYFKDRGYNESTIKKFQLGFTTSEKKDFTETAVKKQFNLDYLKLLGLSSQYGSDFFRSRVMFTIQNLSGKVIGFAGRTLSQDKKTPKYINSPESEIYNKRKVLYAMNFAKSSIRKEDECIIVEGYTDVITLHQNGVENVVASSGTSLTKEQIALVRRNTSNIKIIYDGDKAGVKAALRGLDLVLEEGMNVRLVLLPDGEDPDSYMKSVGVDAFKKYLKEKEEDFVLFKTNLLLDEAGDDPIRRSVVLKDIVKSIAKIPDLIKRSLYIQRCSKLLEISEKILIEETNKVIKADQKQQYYTRENAKAKAIDSGFPSEELIATEAAEKPDGSISLKGFIEGDDYQERDLLRVLLCFGNDRLSKEVETTVAEFILEIVQLEIDHLDNDLIKDMFVMALNQFEESGRININAFTSSTNEKIRQLAIDFLATPYTYAKWEEKGLFLQTQKYPEENQEKDSQQSVLRFLLRKSEKRIEELESMILEMSKDPTKEEEMIRYIKALKIAQTERTELVKQLGGVFLK